MQCVHLSSCFCLGTFVDSLSWNSISSVALQREDARLHAPQPSQRDWRQSTVLAPARVQEKPVVEEKPKKKGGLAKIWRLVTGNAKQKGGSAHLNSTHTRSLDRTHEMDFPLEPPPPLSYLVNRSSGGGGGRGEGGGGVVNEHAAGGNALRHVSTSSLPSSSPNYAFSSSTGVSPPTAPSSLVPSPTSSRVGEGNVHSRKLSGHQEYEVEHPQPSPVPEEPGTASRQPSPRNIHTMTSEPDMRRSSQLNLNMANAPPVPRIPATITSRPESQLSMTWRDKSLPPIPLTEDGVRIPMMQQQQMDMRPRTVMTYDPRPVSQMDPYTQSSTFLAAQPQPPFRNEYPRRQSFNGLGSSPNLVPQPERNYGTVAYPSGSLRATSGEPYNEFGGLAPGSQAESMRQRSSTLLSTPTTPTSHKRRSRFALSALLGKKSSGHDQHLHSDSPQPRSSGSEAKHSEALGYGNPMQHHEANVNLGLGLGGVHSPLGSGTAGSGSGSGHGTNARMSMASQKKLDALVDQAPEFVAYRYPSNDQNLDLLR